MCAYNIDSFKAQVKNVILPVLLTKRYSCSTILFLIELDNVSCYNLMFELTLIVFEHVYLLSEKDLSLSIRPIFFSSCFSVSCIFFFVVTVKCFEMNQTPNAEECFDL